MVVKFYRKNSLIFFLVNILYEESGLTKKHFYKIILNDFECFYLNELDIFFKCFYLNELQKNKFIIYHVSEW